MIRLFRTLAVAAAFILALTTGPVPVAQAAAVTSSRLAQTNDIRAAVGDQWQEILPTGEKVTMEKVAPGVTRSVAAIARTPGQCTGWPYLCAWSGDNFNGTYWRYDMNHVWANTANGVAHCWNLASDANNNTKSWLNQGDKDARLNNWVNCNASGETFDLKRGRGIRCLHITGQFGDWCSELRVTSIRAIA